MQEVYTEYYHRKTSNKRPRRLFETRRL